MHKDALRLCLRRLAPFPCTSMQTFGKPELAHQASAHCAVRMLYNLRNCGAGCSKSGSGAGSAAAVLLVVHKCAAMTSKAFM